MWNASLYGVNLICQFVQIVTEHSRTNDIIKQLGGHSKIYYFLWSDKKIY